MQTRRLPDIDALRGIAVALVVLAHVPGCLLSSAPAWTAPVGFAFAVGVEIFFAISGFVIGRSLLPDMRRGAALDTRWLTIRSFWLRRAKRLLPAAYLWLAIPCLLSFALGTSSFDTPFSTLQAAAAAVFEVFNALLAYRFQHHLDPGPLFHYWSLSLEEQFYAVVPFVVLLSRRRLILSLLCSVPIACATIGPYGSAFRFEELLSGLALAALAENSRRLSVLEEALKGLRRFLPMLSFATLLGVVLLGSNTLAASFGPPWHLWLARLGIAIGSTTLVFLASCDCGALVGRGLIYQLLLGLGRRSYSIYLVHVSAFFGAREILSRARSGGVAGDYADVWTLVIGLGLVAVLGETTYRFVERSAWPMPGLSRLLQTGATAPVLRQRYRRCRDL